MTTLSLRTKFDALTDVETFAAKHPEFGHLITRRMNDPVLMLNVRPPRLTIALNEAGWHETLTDVIVAARRDGIPVAFDHSGSFMWAALDFDGLILRAMDYHTTCGKRSALESLADCPIADLDRVLDAVVENRKYGS